MRYFEVKDEALMSLCMLLEGLLRQYPDSDGLASLKQQNVNGLTGNSFCTALEQELNKVKPIRICEDGSIWGKSDGQSMFIAKLDDDISFQDVIQGKGGFERYAKTWGREILDTRDGEIDNA